MKKFAENEYVIWIELNEECTAFLDEKCEALEKSNITAGVRPPHLTITFIRTDDEERLIQYTKSFINEHNVNIMFNSIGVFTGGVVFYGPAASKELLKFQSDFCNGAADFGKLSWDLYYPGNWTPHIALTGELDEETTVKAFSNMLKGFSAMESPIKKVVIKNSKGKVVLDYLLPVL